METDLGMYVNKFAKHFNFKLFLGRLSFEVKGKFKNNTLNDQTLWFFKNEYVIVAISKIAKSAKPLQPSKYSVIFPYV